MRTHYMLPETKYSFSIKNTRGYKKKIFCYLWEQVWCMFLHRIIKEHVRGGVYMRPRIYRSV